MIALLRNRWRRLFAAESPSGRRSADPPGEGDSKSPSPVADFKPREGEIVHAHGPARGYDPARERDLGPGRMLVTNHGLVYSTDVRRWRFHWGNLAGIELKEGRTLRIETLSGKQFRFQLPSVPEADTMWQAIVAANANPDGGDDRDS